VKTKVQKWGNSLSVRLPKTVAQEMGLQVNDILEIEIDDHRLILEARKDQEYRLTNLMKEVTEDNLHTEISVGAPVGNETL